MSLESELDRARDLDVPDLADAIETIGFECTRCGACCKGAEADEDAEANEGAEANEDAEDTEADKHTEDHTATIFPDEVRRLQRQHAADTDDTDDTGTAEQTYDWRDVARPMPYGLDSGEGETFEWALQTDSCGDCVFYEETDGEGACSAHEDRPHICRTYPFSVGSLSDDDEVAGRTEPMGGVVEEEGLVRAHECEGLGRDISRAEAEELAAALKQRAVRELEEALAVRDSYEPVDAEGVVVHDSEGQKRPDGTPIGDERSSDGHQ